MTSHEPGLRSEDIRRLRHGLRIMALHALGDGEAAEEVTQETLVRTMEAFRDEAREVPRNLGAFARGIARNVIADQFEDWHRQAPLDRVPYDRGGATWEDPLGGIVSEEERRRVRRVLLELSEADREILRLCFYDGLAPREVARHLGEPTPRIRKRKSRALQRLRRAMSQDTSPGGVLHTKASAADPMSTT